MMPPSHVDYEQLETELFALLERYTNGQNGSAAICALVEVAMKVFRLAGSTAHRLALAQAALLVVLHEIRAMEKAMAPPAQEKFEEGILLPPEEEE
jgi:hypothetical protein